MRALKVQSRCGKMGGVEAQGVAAVDVPGRVGHVPGLGSRQERHDIGDVAGLSVGEPTAVNDRTASPNSPEAGFRSVSTGPGWTVLTVMPPGPSSRAGRRTVRRLRPS